jgi:glucose/arabinose dehydrogenase
MRKTDYRSAVFSRRLLVGLLALLLVGVSACGVAAPDPTSAPTSVSSLRVSEPASTPEPASEPAQAPSPEPARPLPSPPATENPVRPAQAPASPSPAPSAAPALPALEELRLRLVPVAAGLDRPVFVTHAGDGSGRLFIAEKGGVVRVLEKGKLLSGPFLDLRGRVLSRGSEQGLLGLAFAPDFGSSGYLFVDYIDLSGNSVTSRFRVTGNPNVADPSSEFKVLGIDQPAANHNGGMLAFGPDGYLYIGTGDGGGAGDRYGNGQNPASLLGKMLRLDVTSDPSVPYTIPPDNPWVQTGWNGQKVRGEIWALGLRNPWRYDFDRATGDLWIADVGQNQYEEIDLVQSAGGKLAGGLNFGWPIMEGSHCFPDGAACRRDGLALPIAEYSHGADGCSITGGYVYRGAAAPALAGAYLYGDYCSGRIWGLSRGPDNAWQSRLLLESGLSISSFGEDEAGEIYVADLSGGAVYRIAAG